jgi:hypothetical protein
MKQTRLCSDRKVVSDTLGRLFAHRLVKDASAGHAAYAKRQLERHTNHLEQLGFTVHPRLPCKPSSAEIRTNARRNKFKTIEKARRKMLTVVCTNALARLYTHPPHPRCST